MQRGYCTPTTCTSAFLRNRRLFACQTATATSVSTAVCGCHDVKQFTYIASARLQAMSNRFRHVMGDPCTIVMPWKRTPLKTTMLAIIGLDLQTANDKTPASFTPACMPTFLRLDAHKTRLSAGVSTSAAPSTCHGMKQ